MRNTSSRQRADFDAINLLTSNTMLTALDLLQMHHTDQKVWSDRRLETMPDGTREVTVRYHRPFESFHTVFKVTITADMNLKQVQLIRYGQCRLNIAMVPHNKASYRTMIGKLRLKLMTPEVVAPGARQRERIRLSLQRAKLGYWYP